MKRKLQHLLSVFVALVATIPIANAAAGDYKINAPTKNWTTTFTTPNDNSRQLAISKDGVPYTLSETDKWYYNGTGYVGTYRLTKSGATLVNLGWWTAGAANAFDDAGNYITHTAGSGGPNQSATLSPATKYSVRNYSENLNANTGVFPSGKTIDMSSINTGGITLYCDATGDVYNANGLLWFAPTGTSTKIIAISVGVSGNNLAATGKKEFDTGIASGGGNESYIQFYESSNASAMKCLMHLRGQGIYDITLNYTTGTVTSVALIPDTENTENYSLGAHIFMMRGRKLLCRNTRRLGADGTAKNKYSEFEILDITDSYTNPTKIATIDHLPGKYSNGSSVGNGHNTGSFIQTYKHSEDQVEIFAYVQGSGCSSYTITASAITNPVTLLSAALVDGTTSDIKVSWGKPSQGTATKYQVCYSSNGGSSASPSKYAVSYSSNGGSSWSTPVETTSLSHTFSNLTPGTYTFKVVPYYANSWGDETVTATVQVLSVTGYKFTTTKLWEVAGTWGTDAAPDGRSIAVSNNKMYVASSNTDTKIAYVAQGTSSASWPTFESGFTKGNYGLAMDNDDAGNIIMASGVYFGSTNGFAQLSIYPAGATSNAGKVDIQLSGDYLPGSRCDFIAAQGNLLSAAGGYVWLAPVKGQKIMRIKIANGALAGITVWPQTISSDSNSNQILLRPLNDGRVYFHFRSTGYRIITLPSAGEAITTDMIESIPATGYDYNPYSNLSSDMFTLQGYTFHVRNDGAAEKSIGVTINNLTDKGNGDASFVPFNGTTPAGGSSNVSGISGYGTLVRAVNVDDLTTDVYCYSPNHGVTVYRVSAKEVHVATDALGSLSYNYSKVDSQQNIVLTWTAPDEASPSAYKIYRNGALIATVDASTLTYTDKGVNQNHTYKVVPIFSGATENGELGLEVTTSGVETVLNAPIITETRSYDGYSITQIFYQMPSGNKVKPQHFNIYRDGVLVKGGMTMFNYIDDSLPKTATTQTYVYTIEAVYGDAYGNATRVSEQVPVEVAPRDWALTGYGITEIYNVPVNRTLGNFPNNFDDHEYYRQGYFHDGHWYIAQLADQLSRKDQGIEGGAINKSDIEGSTGGGCGYWRHRGNRCAQRFYRKNNHQRRV